MGVKKAPEAITTKTGETVTLNYCRKCMQNLPAKEFYECTDAGFVDANGLQSVCKSCVQEIYEYFYTETKSIEKAIHKTCVSLNMKYSNECASATKSHIETLLEGGKKVNTVMGIFKSKLIATNPSMNKSAIIDLTYSDMGAIYTSQPLNIKEIKIPDEVIVFWGDDLTRDDIQYLEMEYTSFKGTHKADTYAEITLFKRVCYTLLDIKHARLAGDDTNKLVKELQDLMKNLAISPNAINASGTDKGLDTFGLWIQDIEKQEPAQWLKTDPRGDMYRDAGNVEEYFQKYIVRPLKNFITGSKDFNIDESSGDDDDDMFLDDVVDYKNIDDGEVGEV